MSMNTHDNPESERQKQIAYGREVLQRENIDPDLYKQYYPIMAEVDVPLTNRMPTEMFITNEVGLASAEDSWNSLKLLYDQIDVSKLNEETGRSIVEEMKQLFLEFDKEFKNYAGEARSTRNFVFPQQLTELKRKIHNLGTRYADEVPAYKAYRFVGRFELDAQGRRGYQSKEDKN